MKGVLMNSIKKLIEKMASYFDEGLSLPTEFTLTGQHDNSTCYIIEEGKVSPNDALNGTFFTLYSLGVTVLLGEVESNGLFSLYVMKADQFQLDEAIAVILDNKGCLVTDHYYHNLYELTYNILNEYNWSQKVLHCK